MFFDNKFMDNLKAIEEFEFNQIRQGNMPVGEYAKMFEDMANYSNKAIYALDEKWKIN